jgi:hypothetical protein
VANFELSSETSAIITALAVFVGTAIATIVGYRKSKTAEPDVQQVILKRATVADFQSFHDMATQLKRIADHIETFLERVEEDKRVEERARHLADRWEKHSPPRG